MSVIKLALAKGRLAEETLKLLERAGIILHIVLIPPVVMLLRRAKLTLND